ncbi:MAG: carboxypeptidase regulatory-like domain-containing protein [Desulfovibrionaceae bacterium]
MLRTISTALLLLLLLSGTALARSAVSGIVVGPDGPLAGVEIHALESDLSTHSGPDGRFTLELPTSGPLTLRFSLQGYKTLTRSMDEAATDVIVSLRPVR